MPHLGRNRSNWLGSGSTSSGPAPVTANVQWGPLFGGGDTSVAGSVAISFTYSGVFTYEFNTNTSISLTSVAANYNTETQGSLTHDLAASYATQETQSALTASVNAALEYVFVSQSALTFPAISLASTLLTESTLTVNSLNVTYDYFPITQSSLTLALTAEYLISLAATASASLTALALTGDLQTQSSLTFPALAATYTSLETRTSLIMSALASVYADLISQSSLSFANLNLALANLANQSALTLPNWGYGYDLTTRSAASFPSLALDGTFFTSRSSCKLDSIAYFKVGAGSDTVTVPSNATSTVFCSAWGGGGGSGGGGIGRGGGGGGASHGTTNNLSVTPGTTVLTFNVGAKGNGGAVNTNGGVGGTSWVSKTGANPATSADGCRGPGGGGGISGAAGHGNGGSGSAGTPIGTSTFTGGNGGNNGGGGGGGAGSLANGSAGTGGPNGAGGNGGGALGGHGGRQGDNNGLTEYGGGGGGGDLATAGKDGSVGLTYALITF